MKTFYEFISEGLGQKVKSAIYEKDKPNEHYHWFDMDDTLVHNNPENGARVHVTNSEGKRVKTLTPTEFNSYKLKDGEKHDFSEFLDSNVFKKSASPIHKMIRHAKRLVDSGHHVGIITARADMNEPHILLGALNSMGLDMNKVHLHRAGNQGKGPTHVNKAKTLHNAIQRLKSAGHNIKTVTGYDDHKPNVTDIHDVEVSDGKTLRDLHPNISFNGIHVTGRGKSVRVKKVTQ